MTGIVFGGGGSGSLAALNNAATSTDILKNKKAYNDKGDVITGAIISKGAETFAASADGDRVISGGQYLAGDQVIKAVQTEQKSGFGADLFFGNMTFSPVAGKFISFVNIDMLYIATVKHIIVPDNRYKISCPDLGMIPLAVFFCKNASSVDPSQLNGRLLNGFVSRRGNTSDSIARGYQTIVNSSGGITISELSVSEISWVKEDFYLNLSKPLFISGDEYRLEIVGLVP